MNGFRHTKIYVRDRKHRLTLSTCTCERYVRSLRSLPKWKLSTMQLLAKLACWLNSVPPFSIFSMHLYTSGPVVTFYPTNVFWTRSTKNNSLFRRTRIKSGMYFPTVQSPGVLWYVWSLYSIGSRSFFWKLQQDHWADQFLRLWFVFLEISYSTLSFNIISRNLRRSNVSVSYAEDRPG